MEQALTSRFSASATLDLTSKKATGRDIIVRAAASSQLFKYTSLPRKKTISISSTSRTSRKSSPVKNLRSMASSGSEFSPQGTTKLAVLLEVEGVLADVHKFGHRRSFNLAFQEFSLECANWSEPVYADLLRRAGGVEEAMLQAFFDRIGWPSSLPTNEKDAFVRNIMKAKQRALEKVAASGELPLRPGISEFIDEVLQAGVPLILLSAYNKSGEQVARSLIAQLRQEQMEKIKIVGEAEVESSAYGQVVLGAGAVAGLDEQLALEAAKAVAAEKQRVAEEVANMLAVSIEVDTNFTQTSRKMIAALRAAAEIAEVDMDQCLLLAGTQSGPQAASRIGMPCVVVRSSATARAEFPLARAALDGFGPGDVTLRRLQKFLDSNQRS